jgi:hypothetical protein
VEFLALLVLCMVVMVTFPFMAMLWGIGEFVGDRREAKEKARQAEERVRAKLRKLAEEETRARPPAPTTWS